MSALTARAGIAHELNTPIGNSLLTATELSDMEAEFDKKYRDGGIKRSALEAHLADTTGLRTAGYGLVAVAQ